MAERSESQTKNDIITEKNSESQKKDDTMTECSICTNKFSNPKILPCFHSFCLECVEKLGRGKNTGEKVACPLCKIEFQIPKDGFANLPTNFFLEKLVEMATILEQPKGETKCDVCNEGDNSNEDEADSGEEELAIVKIAIKRCVICRNNLCKQCARQHKRQGGTKTHHLIALDDTLKPEQLARSIMDYCQDHHENSEKVRAEIFCVHCKKAVCMMCANFGTHREHQVECQNIHKVADEYRGKMQNNIDGIGNSISKNKALTKQLTSEKQKFEKHMDETKELILKREETLRKLLESHTKAMLTSVLDLKNEKSHEYDTVITAANDHTLNMERFKKYATEIKEKGTPLDTACWADEIDEQAKKLEALDIVGDVWETSFKVNFTASTFEAAFSIDKDNIVGEIEKQLLGPTFVHLQTIDSTGYQVRGMTVMNGELYIVRHGQANIAIYELDTFTLQRNTPTVACFSASHGTDINISNVVDMASCATNICLYIADKSYNCVFKVGLNGNMDCWYLAVDVESLSVNAVANILITVANQTRVYEYNPAGAKVREIVTTNMPSPRHAWQLFTGQLVVCHGDPNSGVNRVCIVEADGQTIVKEYGAQFGPGDSQLNQPNNLAVSSKGNVVIVADMYNNRLVVLYPSLQFYSLVTVPGVTFAQPSRLHLDEAGGHLFVTETSSGTIFILKADMNAGLFK